MPKSDPNSPKEINLGSHDIYSRLPGESSEAFYGFTVYRDLGPMRRSLAETSRLLQVQKTESSTTLIFPDLPQAQTAGQQEGGNKAATRRRAPGIIHSWSRKWKWVERVQAWDDYLDKSRQQVYKDAISEMAETHAKQCEFGTKAMMPAVAGFVESLKDERRNGRWKKANPFKMLEAAIECMKLLPKLQEAERIAKGVRVRTRGEEETAPNGGDIEWEISTYQPPRLGPAVDISSFDDETQKKVHWEGDSPEPEEEDPAEGQAFAPKNFRR